MSDLQNKHDELNRKFIKISDELQRKEKELALVSERLEELKRRIKDYTEDLAKKTQWHSADIVKSKNVAEDTESFAKVTQGYAKLITTSENELKNITPKYNTLKDEIRRLLADEEKTRDERDKISDKLREHHFKISNPNG